MDTFRLVHADLVLPSGVVRDASLTVEGGRISSIDGVGSRGVPERSAGRSLVMPGVVDLHGDGIEQAVQLRPGVHAPLAFALHRADLRCAAAGVTTTYHALSFAGREQGLRDERTVLELIELIAEPPTPMLVEHRVHCRYEIGYPDGASSIERLIERGVCGVVSLMDHTPGQGQFHSMDVAVEYLMRTYGIDQGEASAIIGERLPVADARVAQRMLELGRFAVSHGVPVASHDDDTPERVRLVAGVGATISEFPMNREAAEAAREMGLAGVVGAPNAFRGRSQSKGPRAADMIAAGYATILCSDYSPESMIPGAFRLAEELSWPIERALALITSNPAASLNLPDRGLLAVGLRADLVAVDASGPFPRVTDTWLAGRRAVSLQCALTSEAAAGARVELVSR